MGKRIHINIVLEFMIAQEFPLNFPKLIYILTMLEHGVFRIGALLALTTRQIL